MTRLKKTEKMFLKNLFFSRRSTVKVIVIHPKTDKEVEIGEIYYSPNVDTYKIVLCAMISCLISRNATLDKNKDKIVKIHPRIYSHLEKVIPLISGIIEETLKDIEVYT
jgi:anaerobic selenocysteine-containing dehydrogenase